MSFNAAADAKALRDAMKGLGTDEDTLTRIIPFRTTPQLEEIKAEFKKEYNKDLIDNVRSELSGTLESAVAGLLYPPAEYDAYILHKAMSGVGTKEHLVVEVLTHRTAEDMAALNAAYKKMYSTSLEGDLKGDLSGDDEHLFVTLARGVREDRGAGSLKADVDKLYAAGEGTAGTKERTFIDVLATASEGYLEQLNVAYAQAHGHTITMAVEKEFGGVVKDALLALLVPTAEYYAKRIHEAIAGFGTDEVQLVRLIVANRPRMAAIDVAFMKLYQETLASRVGSELGGNLKEAVVGAVTTR